MIDTERAREELIAAAKTSDDAVVAWVAANVDLLLAEVERLHDLLDEASTDRDGWQERYERLREGLDGARLMANVYPDQCDEEWEPLPDESTHAGLPIECDHHCHLEPGHDGRHWCCGSEGGTR